MGVTRWPGDSELPVALRCTALLDFQFPGQMPADRVWSPFATMPYVIMYNKKLDGSAIIKNAPHPKAAKLLLDWTVSKAMQQLMVERFGRRSPRTRSASRSGSTPFCLQHGDLDRVLGLVAPRPFLALAGEGDPIFPLAGVRATVRKARRAYAAAAHRVRLRVYPGGHGFSAPMREAAYAWLDRWLRPGGP